MPAWTIARHGTRFWNGLTGDQIATHPAYADVVER